MIECQDSRLNCKMCHNNLTLNLAKCQIGMVTRKILSHYRNTVFRLLQIT